MNPLHCIKIWALCLAFQFAFPLTATFPDEHLDRSTSSLSSYSSLSSDEERDEFSWQNNKHYKELVEVFSQLAERELESLVALIIEEINSTKHSAFFERRRESVIDNLKEFIFDWAIKNIPQEVSDSHTTPSEDCMSDDENYTSEADDMSDETSCGSSSPRLEDVLDSHDKNIEERQLRWLRSNLEIDLEDIDKFSIEDVTEESIEKNLEEIVGEEPNWLINPILEQELCTSRDLISEFADSNLNLENIYLDPKDLLIIIFDDLTDDLKWAENDIMEVGSIEGSYISALEDFQNDSDQNLKEYLLQLITQQFSLNGKNFDSPLQDIRIRYNQSAKDRNWRKVLCEWSVYSMYRKIFQNPKKGKKINLTHSSTSDIIFFNKQSYVQKSLKDALHRARDKYTKVYPHPKATKIGYNGVEFNISKILGQLKSFGLYLERLKSKAQESQNILVPALYFIVEKRTPSGSHPDIEFVVIPIPAKERTHNVPLNCNKEDEIFSSSEEDYFQQAKSDIVTGWEIQGNYTKEGEKKLDSIISGGNRNQPLIHSERVLIQDLRKTQTIDGICKSLENALLKKSFQGNCHVYGGGLLGYSTNSICDYCTPSIIGLLNSHGKGQFLKKLTDTLRDYDSQLKFTLNGYNATKNQMDWTQFRFNAFFTCKVDFYQNVQARDVCEKDQRKSNKIPHKAHNPHSKLFFKKNTINITSAPFKEKQPDPKQRFFYEFVGSKTHLVSNTQEKYVSKDMQDMYFPGATYISSSDARKKRERMAYKRG